jgi:hypothetical protein
MCGAHLWWGLGGKVVLLPLLLSLLLTYAKLHPSPFRATASGGRRCALGTIIVVAATRCWECEVGAMTCDA